MKARKVIFRMGRKCPVTVAEGGRVAIPGCGWEPELGKEYYVRVLRSYDRFDIVIPVVDGVVITDNGDVILNSNGEEIVIRKDRGSKGKGLPGWVLREICLHYDSAYLCSLYYSVSSLLLSLAPLIDATFSDDGSPVASSWPHGGSSGAGCSSIDPGVPNTTDDAIVREVASWWNGLTPRQRVEFASVLGIYPNSPISEVVEALYRQYEQFTVGDIDGVEIGGDGEEATGIGLLEQSIRKMRELAEQINGQQTEVNRQTSKEGW